MKRTKIAPMVQHAVEVASYPFPASANGKRAEAELRALLSVARAAERWGQEPYMGDRLPGPGHAALARAVRRLARLSRKRGERGGKGR